MKKFIVLIIVVCLAFAGAVGYLNARDIPAQETPAAQIQAPTEDAAQTPEQVEIEKLDYEKLYALHQSDETVMMIDGKDINWGEYFSWLYMSAIQTEQYFNTMANYGMPLSWSDPVGDDPEVTYASSAITGAENTLKQILTIEGFAQSKGVEASEATLNAIEEQKKSDMAATVGEDGTDEDFAQYLMSLYRSEDAYERTLMANFISQQQFADTYGENAEKVSDEQAMAYLEENGYLSANHILFMTIDPQTGEALDEAAIAEKKASAEKLAAELQAIEDQEELVKRFKELKEEYCEDSGKTAYPDGYVFLPGEMVEAFENGCKALENYEVSDPVESPYGYHVIMRLPVSADTIITYSNDGAAYTARNLFANFDYAKGLDEYLENLKIEYVQGFEPVNMTEFVIK